MRSLIRILIFAAAPVATSHLAQAELKRVLPTVSNETQILIAVAPIHAAKQKLLLLAEVVAFEEQQFKASTPTTYEYNECGTIVSWLEDRIASKFKRILSNLSQSQAQCDQAALVVRQAFFLTDYGVHATHPETQIEFLSEAKRLREEAESKTRQALLTHTNAEADLASVMESIAVYHSLAEDSADLFHDPLRACPPGTR